MDCGEVVAQLDHESELLGLLCCIHRDPYRLLSLLKLLGREKKVRDGGSSLRDIKPQHNKGVNKKGNRGRWTVKDLVNIALSPRPPS